MGMGIDNGKVGWYICSAVKKDCLIMVNHSKGWDTKL